MPAARASSGPASKPDRRSRQLAAAVDEALDPLGIAREAREFRPHLTLARFDSPQGLEPLRAAVAKLGRSRIRPRHRPRISPLPERAEAPGAEYTRLATYLFIGESAS